MLWQKTTKQDVFDFIVRYEKGVRDSTGVEGVYPSGVLIGSTFGITGSRGSQYLSQFKAWKKSVEKAKQRA